MQAVPKAWLVMDRLGGKGTAEEKVTNDDAEVVVGKISGGSSLGAWSTTLER